MQDEGSQLVARALTLAELDGADGGRWLDLCAGPGGKTALLAAIGAAAGARVTAVEPAPRRADLVEENTRGLAVEVLRVDGRDARARSPASTGSWSTRRAPGSARCGAGRRPAGGARPADVPALTKLQRELLASAIALTRPGGVVLYATCSPHLAETVGVVADALRRHPVDGDGHPAVCSSRPSDLGDGPYVQLWPHRHGTDAMFARRRCASTGLSPCRRPLIAPSILAADFARLADEAAAVDRRRLAARRRDGQPLRAEPDDRAAGGGKPARSTPTSRWTAT